MKKIFLIFVFSCFFSALSFAQSKAEKRFEKAVQLLRTNQVEDAQKELLSLKDKYPEFLSSYLALSEIYIAQNNIEQAKQELLTVWQKDKTFDCKLYIDLANKMIEVGVKYFIFTDISKDGTLSGVNVQQLKALADATEGRANIVASGGVHTMNDIIACKEMGLYGTICGKSIYKGTLNLKEAIDYAER